MTASDRDRPLPRARSRASSVRAFWRSVSRCSRGPVAQSAYGSSSRSTPSSLSAETRASSRPVPGSMRNAERSASSWGPKSTSRLQLEPAQMLARSASSSSAAGGPRRERTERASVSAFDKALDAASGLRLGKSASQAASLPILRPGLTSTSSHSLLAVGRGHGPASFSLSVMAKGPNIRTATPSSEGSLPRVATASLCPVCSRPA